jgi:hypothetical protein
MVDCSFWVDVEDGAPAANEGAGVCRGGWVVVEQRVHELGEVGFHAGGVETSN